MTNRKVEIIDSEAGHPRLLCMALRQADRQEVLNLGFNDPYEALFFAYRHAVIKRTAFVDGEIAAMWGVCGVPLSIIGQPYLLTAEPVEWAPITFVKTFKSESNEMLRIFPVLENYVDADYTGAVKLLQLAGFTLSPPEKLGKSMFRKFVKKSV